VAAHRFVLNSSRLQPRKTVVGCASNLMFNAGGHDQISLLGVLASRPQGSRQYRPPARRSDPTHHTKQHVAAHTSKVRCPLPPVLRALCAMQSLKRCVAPVASSHKARVTASRAPLIVFFFSRLPPHSKLWEHWFPSVVFPQSCRRVRPPRRHLAPA
jgi:hypothetical protein